MKNPSYEMKLKSKTDKGKEIYKFVSADGVPAKNNFRDAELALADAVEPKPEDEILVVQSGYGFLPVILADQAPQGETLAAETSDYLKQLEQLNLITSEYHYGGRKGKTREINRVSPFSY